MFGDRAHVPLTPRARCLECGKKGVSRKSWDCQYCGESWRDQDDYASEKAALKSTAAKEGESDGTVPDL